MAQPIDLQTELARTTIVERIVDLSGRLSLAAQQRAAAEAEAARVLMESQVDEPHRTEADNVDGDGRRKNPFVSKRKKGRPEPDPEGAEGLYDTNEGRVVVRAREEHRLDLEV